MEKFRSWVEIVTDLIELIFAALTSPKGLELIDELLTVLDLPDLLPDIDGLQADNATPTPTPRPTVADVMKRAGAVNVQQVDNETGEPISASSATRKHATLKDILNPR